MIRIAIIDPYDGDRDPGDWSAGIEVRWWRRDRGVHGFRGLTLTVFRWALIVGQEVEP